MYLLFSRASHTAERDYAVCVSRVCGNFFPTNPYLKGGLTDLDEIWHDGNS